MYSLRKTKTITQYTPGIYRMQPLEGCAAYLIEREGAGVGGGGALLTPRPSDILQIPLPSQKRKG